MKKLLFVLTLCLASNAFAEQFDPQGKKIGVQLGTTGDILASEMPSAEVERYNKAGDAIQSLLAGKVDAVLIDEQPALAFAGINKGLSVSAAAFAEESYAIAVAKGNAALKADLNRVLADLKNDGTVSRVLKNYIGDDKGMYPPSSHAGDCPNGQLKVATNATFPPYEFHDKGKIVGIDIDLAAIIAERLGKCAVVNDMEFDAIVPALQAGKADIGMAGMTVTPERLKSIDFTDAYTTARQVVVERAAAVGTDEPRWADRVKTVFVQDSRWKYLLTGLETTLVVTLLAAIVGVVCGTFIGIVRVAHDENGNFAVLNALCRVYLTVVRGTPAVIQLLIMYYIVFAGADVGKIWVAAAAFGLNSAAYVAEIARAGILSVDAGQAEAGRSLGLNYAQTMRFIVLPQAFKNVLPAFANEAITLLKETSVCGYIGLMDLTRGGDIIRSVTYDAVLPLAAVALIYLVLVVGLTAGVSKWEKRLKRNER